MNKPYLLVTLLFFIYTFSNAQEFALGLRGGLNNNTIGDINSIGGSFQTGHPDEVFSPNKKTGYQFGAFLNIEFGKFFVRPEINFVELKNSYDFPNSESKWSTSKMDIPLLIGYKIYEPVSIYVGPGFNFYDDALLEGANNASGASKINYISSATTFIVGVNVEFKYFGVDLRYEMGNKEILEERNDMHFSDFGINQADIYSYKPSMISINLNVFLFRTNAEDVGGIFSGLFRNKKCYCPY